MAIHLDSHTTNHVKPVMFSGVQPGNGITHEEYEILAMCTQTEKTTLSCQDN